MTKKKDPQLAFNLDPPRPAFDPIFAPRADGFKMFDEYVCTRCGAIFRWGTDDITGRDGLWHRIKPLPDVSEDAYCGPLEGLR